MLGNLNILVLLLYKTNRDEGGQFDALIFS